MSDTVNGTGPIPEILRNRLRNIIGGSNEQLLHDFDVDPDLLRHDVDYGAALDAMIDHVVQSVRLFDAALTAERDALRDAHAENARILGLLENELQGRIEAGKLAAISKCANRSRAALKGSTDD